MNLNLRYNSEEYRIYFSWYGETGDYIIRISDNDSDSTIFYGTIHLTNNVDHWIYPISSSFIKLKNHNKFNTFRFEIYENSENIFHTQTPEKYLIHSDLLVLNDNGKQPYPNFSHIKFDYVFMNYVQFFYNDCYKDFFTEDMKVAIDVGANNGVFTEYLLSKGFEKIYAVEPVEKCCNLMYHHYKDNNKVVVINKAFDHSITSKILHIHKKNTTISSYNKEGRKFDGSTDNDFIDTHINTITLERILSDYNISKIDLLKIDIEGAEYDIFDKINLEALKKVKNIILEYHNNLNDKLDIIIHKLNLANFEIIENIETPTNFQNSKYADFGTLIVKQKNKLQHIENEKVLQELEPIINEEVHDSTFKGQLLQFYSDIKINKENYRDFYRVEFYNGATVRTYGGSDKKYNVSFVDQDTNQIIYKTTIENNEWAAPNRKYFTNWKVTVDDVDYKLNLKDKKVLIALDSKALGDTLAWIPYVEIFTNLHQCKTTVSTFWNHLFTKKYPDLKFVPPGVRLAPFYAYYRIGCSDNNDNVNKINWRHITLQQVASDILGIPYHEVLPRVNNEDLLGRPTLKKYVAISEHSTMQAKLWNYNNGWQEIVKYLKTKYNLETLVVSKESTNLRDIYDFTNKSIEETINNISHAEFFIGLGSGTSWLAWALQKPVVMISGFSKPFSEFKYNNYRVFNDKVCNGCYNDIEFKYGRNWTWCPRGNSYICSKAITAKMVMKEIDKVMEKIK